MSESVKKDIVYKDLDDWYRGILKASNCSSNHITRKITEIDGTFIGTYEYVPSVPTKKAVEIVHKHGLKFSREYRYWFVYDKRVSRLVLFLYPFKEVV